MQSSKNVGYSNTTGNDEGMPGRKYFLDLVQPLKSLDHMKLIVCRDSVARVLTFKLGFIDCYLFFEMVKFLLFLALSICFFKHGKIYNLKKVVLIKKFQFTTKQHENFALLLGGQGANFLESVLRLSNIVIQRREYLILISNL